ncbi:MAG: STAS domain-containing protein [Balneolales bacterium]
MKIELNQDGEVSILKLNGERLDSKIAPDLKSRVVILDTEEDANLIIDLSSITFADSSGLGALLLAHRLFRDNQRKLVLAGVTDRVQKLIDISQLGDIFVIAKDADAGIKLLKEGESK